jgi:hypothetical protein
MADRREGAEFGGIADEDVEPAIRVEELRREFVDLGEIAVSCSALAGPVEAEFEPLLSTVAFLVCSWTLVQLFGVRLKPPAAYPRQLELGATSRRIQDGGRPLSC